jgi:exonuclease III
VQGWEKFYQAYGNQKQAGVANLISDKADFVQKSVRRDKEVHYILIKVTIITILNIYAPNIGALMFIKQTLLSLKEQIGPDTIIVEYLNPHSHQ